MSSGVRTLWSLTFWRASRKAAVPLLAMVPMCSRTSSRVMPIPLSETVRVRFSESKEIRIRNALSSPRIPGSVWDLNRSLSMASEAFEMSSLRKMSLLE